MKFTTGLVIVFSSFLFAAPSFAGDVSLADWCVNFNGDISTACNGAGSGGASGTGSISLSSFDSTLEPDTNGLGSITVTLGAGLNQSLAFYADYDVDFSTFGSFQDYGAIAGTLPGSWSYELDDPNTSGIFSDFANNFLTNTNNVGTPGNPPDVCCDVAWALAINGLDVLPGGSGTVTFTIGDTAPCDPSSASCFYIQQTNTDTSDSIYLSADVTIVPPSVGGVPEPSTFVLGLGILGVAAAGMRAKRVRA